MTSNAFLGAQVLTVSDTETTAYWEFGETKPNLAYSVMLVPRRYTGTPPTAAFLVMAIAKTMFGFTITTGAAPGDGNSVTFELVLQL